MYRILVVDDDPSLRRVLKHFLGQQGYEPVTASSLAQARDALADTAFAAVLLDLRLGSESGFDLLELLEGMDSSPPVIVMTGENTPANAIDAMGGGAFEYLVKPFDLEAAAEVVARAVAQMPEPEVVSETAQRKQGGPSLVGRSLAMQDVYKKIGQYSRHDGTVLIQGESGVGKELVAQAVHDSSPRRSQPFIAINMSAIPDTLLESELFGYEKGAFTGADRAQPGKFRQAEGGTLFLDEIGDMPMNVQAKLLRVLQEREVTPIGSVRTYPIDVRIVAATQVNLQEAVREDRFRQDLYFRLNVLPLHVPPLRERSEDIPELVESFLATNPETTGKKFEADALAQLVAYPWPGNVRELQNVVQRVALLAAGASISSVDIASYADLASGQATRENSDENASLQERLASLLFPLFDELYDAGSHQALQLVMDPIEALMIERALVLHKGNQVRVAKFLGINRNTLRRRIEDLQIDLAAIKFASRR